MADAAGVTVEPFRPARYRVVARTEQTADTVTLALDPVDEPIREPAPGQFTMVWCPGVGEVPISTFGRPSDDGHLRQTIRAVGTVTGALCALEPGAMVGVRGPYGHGWALDALAGHDVVVVAGGMGLAPVRPVVQHLLAARASFGRVALLVGARTPADLVDVDEVERWRGRFDIQVEVTVDRGDPAWRGDVGLVTSLLKRVPFDPAATAAVICGPEVMIRRAAQALVTTGVPPEAVQVSLERNMQCALRRCGHCQLGPLFVCAEGPVVTWALAAPLLEVPNL